MTMLSETMLTATMESHHVETFHFPTEAWMLYARIAYDYDRPGMVLDDSDGSCLDCGGGGGIIQNGHQESSPSYSMKVFSG